MKINGESEFINGTSSKSKNCGCYTKRTSIDNFRVNYTLNHFIFIKFYFTSFTSNCTSYSPNINITINSYLIQLSDKKNSDRHI